MAKYVYKGTSQQNSSPHQNKVVAIKVDVTSDEYSILDETTADPSGNFLLQWSDWDGRIAVGVVDDDPTEKLEAVFKDFLYGTESGDINVTQSPTYAIINNSDTGINISQSSTYAIINNLHTGINVTQNAVYAIIGLPFNLNATPPPTPSFDLSEEV